MKLIKKCEYVIKKSRFVSFLYQIDTLEEIDIILNKIRKEEKRATHFPYAFILEGSIKKSDDKEPSGTAGSPILSVLEKNKLNQHLLIIARYFGGIKLGSGGLFRSYLKSSTLTISP